MTKKPEDKRYYIDKDGERRRKPLPKYGGVRGGLSDKSLNFSNPLELTADDFICKYTFQSESEFKYLLAMYLDKVRKHRGYKSADISRRMGKDSSYFAVTKYYGISTFEVWLKICSVLTLDPVKAFDECLGFFRTLKNRKR